MNKLKVILKMSWFSTLYFNFHYLPFKQALKIPIFLYKTRLLKCHGKLIIDSEVIRPGMIRFGEHLVSLYPNTGLVWENHGGKVIFKGKCTIGNASAISIGEKGICLFGDNFRANASFKLTSHYQITFGENTLIAWDLIVMDTSFHRLKDKNGNFKNKGYAPVVIGRNNWITTRCMILSGTKTPDYCSIGAGSILNKDYSHFSTHILIAGNPIEIKAKDVWIDLADHDIPEYV
jgi:acetyltransferase-like isoleucine patch superfamily enzyme